ncbi:hypothetical protein, partial [Raoultella ornithinolytica]|uniref:hypothetical protein n=1 Tax=Raoultella ornithinolytica TaxID=54291 RepID=UPI0039B595DA
LATARRASHVVVSHPLSPTKFKSLLNEQAFLHLKPVRMRSSGGRGSTMPAALTGHVYLSNF